MENIILDSDYMDMELGFAFRFLNTNSLITNIHTHNYYEYFLVESGEVIHNINNEEHVLTSGDLVFIRSNDSHTYRPIPNVECNLINISFRAVHFDSLFNFLGEKNKEILLQPPMPPKFNIFPTNVESNDKQPIFSQIIREHELLKLYKGNSQSLLLYLKTLLFEIIKIILKASTIQEKKISNNSLLESALEKMKTQAALEEGVPALIRFSGLSHGHLCRLMKKHMGITPVDYIKDMRMLYASNMLIRSDMDILSISLLVGYSSLSYFISTFKKKYNMTPSEYRRLNGIPYMG